MGIRHLSIRQFLHTITQYTLFCLGKDDLLRLQELHLLYFINTVAFISLLNALF